MINLSKTNVMNATETPRQTVHKFKLFAIDRNKAIVRYGNTPHFYQIERVDERLVASAMSDYPNQPLIALPNPGDGMPLDIFPKSLLLRLAKRLHAVIEEWGSGHPHMVTWNFKHSEYIMYDHWVWDHEKFRRESAPGTCVPYERDMMLYHTRDGRFVAAMRGDESVCFEYDPEND